MATGLILLGFIALLVAYALTRLRRRMGLPVQAGTWIAIIVAAVLVGLAMWAYSGGK